MRYLGLIFPVFVCILGLSSVYGQPVSRLNIEPAEWHKPGLWSNNSVPAQDDEVQIIIAGAYASGNQEVKILSLALNGSFEQLTVTERFCVGPGGIEQTSGTVQVDGNREVSVDGNLKITGSGSVFKAGSGKLMVGGEFESEGEFDSQTAEMRTGASSSLRSFCAVKPHELFYKLKEHSDGGFVTLPVDGRLRFEHRERHRVTGNLNYRIFNSAMTPLNGLPDLKAVYGINQYEVNFSSMPVGNYVLEVTDEAGKSMVLNFAKK